MPTSPWSGTPLPDDLDADDVPAVLAAIFDNIDSQFNLVADDNADRDARYALLPAGSVVTTLDSFSMWLKTDDTLPLWSDVLYDSGWVTVGFGSSSNFDIVSAKVRRLGADCELRIQMAGEINMVPTTGDEHAGNITGDPLILTVPSGFRPAQNVGGMWDSGFNYGLCRLYTDGSLKVLAGLPTSLFAIGEPLNVSMRYLLG
jgi:hypothetical protein